MIRTIRNLSSKEITIFRRQVNLQVLLTPVILFVLFMLFTGLVQFSTPNMPDNDGFYHIKMAYLMRTEGLKPDFKWLPLTILNPREYYDHHFLFHVLLIPFTFGDLVLGAKWGAVVFASLSFLAVWWLLKKQKIPYASLWSLGLLAVSEAFIYRMSITRAQSLSLALLALALHWLLTGKYARLAVLGFLYVWFYNAFPLLLGVAGAYTVAEWLLARRLDLRPLAFSSLGIALGLLINPYFPYNIIFAFQHILPKLVEATSVSVGNEWYPYTTGQLLENSPFALAVFCSAVFALGFSGRRMDVRTATTLFLACLFGLMLFQSRRFVEYFPPFALIFAAFAWAPVLESLRSRPRQPAGHSTMVLWLRSLAPALVLLATLAPFTWVTLQDAQDSIQGAKPYHLYAGASAWLSANTPPGERVFQTDWDDFPRLFFYNTHNTYLIGLDPTYMQLYDADLYAVWVDITRGNVADPSDLISGSFDAHYILSDHRHRSFLERAEADPGLQEVYRDEDAVVFAVVGD